MNNTTNGNQNNELSKKKTIVARWIIGGFFSMLALVNGFHYSTLFLLCAAFLMFPFPFMQTFLQGRNIKTMVAIILSVCLFFVGALTSPLSQETNSVSNNTQQTVTEKDNSKKTDNSNSNNTTKPDNSNSNNTTKPDNDLSNDEKTEMVWVSSSGSKYHSKSTCSNMKSPKQISVEEAKNKGYTACKNCH